MTRFIHHRRASLVALTAFVAACGLASFLSAAPVPTAATRPTTNPATHPSAEDVMHELMGERQPNPIIDPMHKPPANPVTHMGPTIDPKLMGVAPNTPGAAPVKLIREGEFIVARRGRLIRAPQTNQSVFVFDAENSTASELPMFVLPCQATQGMEDTVGDRGDRVAFTVTGQVFQYRGANYLLPTIAKVAADQGNLKP